MKTMRLILVALFALTVALPVSGTPVGPDTCLLEGVAGSCQSYGLAGATVTITGGEFQTAGQWDSLTEITSKTGALGLIAHNFNWTLGFDADPFFNWTFTSLIPGNYVVNFMIPVIGGPYNFLAHSAGGSITAVPGNTAIAGYKVVVEIPNGSPFAGGAFDLALPDTAVTAPFTTNIPVGFKSGVIAPISPLSMGVTVSWTHIGTGAINLNGGLVLINNAVPEPATFVFVGLALVGLALLRRRHAA